MVIFVNTFGKDGEFLSTIKYILNIMPAAFYFAFK